MMMHMPWVLVAMMTLLVLLVVGALVAVRLLAGHDSVPEHHDSDTS